MPAKFEDLVKAINDAPNEFALSRLPFDVMKQGLANLQARLWALEAKAQTPAPPPPAGG